MVNLLNIIILNNRPNTQLAHIILIPRLILLNNTFEYTNTFEYVTQDLYQF